MTSYRDIAVMLFGVLVVLTMIVVLYRVWREHRTAKGK